MTTNGEKAMTSEMERLDEYRGEVPSRSGLFFDCPAYLDQDGSVPCGLPAEVRCRFTMDSSDGPLESAMIRCPLGHVFNAPIESLTRVSMGKHARGIAGVGSGAMRDGITGGPDGRDGGSGAAVQALPGKPERGGSRPNTTPAFYLGRPAYLWISVMRGASGRSG
jgi:hypothetical protein